AVVANRIACQYVITFIGSFSAPVANQSVLHSGKPPFGACLISTGWPSPVDRAQSPVSALVVKGPEGIDAVVVCTQEGGQLFENPFPYDAVGFASKGSIYATSLLEGLPEVREGDGWIQCRAYVIGRVCRDIPCTDRGGGGYSQ